MLAIRHRVVAGVWSGAIRRALEAWGLVCVLMAVYCGWRFSVSFSF